MNDQNSKIILGGGCFWCIEAVFLKIAGVNKATPGYAGGITDSPTYQSVCSGSDGHAEVVLVEWDKNITNLNYLLDCFFTVHDPTSLNRQGNDIGTQYRSFIGYFSHEHHHIIQNQFKQLNEKLSSPVVTELQSAPAFFSAEKEHQDYYNKNSYQPYCQIVIKPKLDKVSTLQKNK